MLMDVESILDERVDQYDLERFREAYETQRRRGSPSAIATFNYGTALIRSTKSDVVEGTEILEKLLREEPDDINKRDYVYFLAIANARLRNYDRALAYIDILLAAETHNRQASQLREIIEKRMKKDGLFGLAVLGGGAVVVAGIVAALFAARK
ncbi:Mitochondrial fission 1 protein [Trichostrongylus colubriformis]|uniref:Mitochondrial fission 1 protein n=1 Tax=Trichostrongylus colubriformis TaxID=6319 RepID=A0AAN8GBG5_TRICO